MAVASPVENVKGFKFGRNLPLLNQKASLGFEVSSGIRPDVVTALLSGTTPFPDRDIDLAEVALNASTPAPIEFARGSDKVSFSASGGVFAGFGVYRTGGALLNRLGDRAQDFALEALEFGGQDPAPAEPTLLSVLRWGFSAEAKASGAIALGVAGTATLDVSGSSEGLFAVIRRLPSSTPARAVVQTTADSWVLPRQITSIDMIEPGTWIASEGLGSVKVTLGSELGFDFNWVREAELGGLKGDIGLRLQMGINAAVGFSASGRCAVVVSRESEARALRLRFFRLRSRGLDVSLNASVAIQARDSLLPGQIDDFIAAVFDTHGEQILRDLRILEKWTDPNRKLSDLLAEAGIDGAERLIAHLAGVPPERLQKEFDAVHDKALGFLDKWHGLPHRVAAPLLKLVEQKTSRADVRVIATKLTTITPEDLRSLLEDRLTRIEFLHTPGGRMLEAMAGGSALNLLSMPIDDVHAIAGRMLDVLDGGGTEDTLVRFQDFVERELRLDRIFKVATNTDFAALDGFLKRKLAAFLDQHTVLLDDLEKIRKVIRLLLDKRDEYYEKALEALHRQYEFSLNSTFSSTTTGQALLDATFDFSLDPARVTALFQQALQGNLDDLLLNQPPQVKLARAQLTHGLGVQSHVTVSLPFTTSTESHLNEALASVEAIPDNGGLLFSVKASDTVASNERKGVLSLALGLAAAGSRAGGVRLHQSSLEMNYSLVFARRNMQTKHVRTIVGPSIKAFFTRKIGDPEEFIDLLDRQAEAVIPNGPNLLGNGLISLQVSMSATSAAKIGAAWLKLPKQRDADVYLAMSNAIQASLKRNIHDAFFSGPDAYSNAITTARIILAYCALVPRANTISRKERIPYWDVQDPAERRNMLRRKQTVDRMTTLLTRASEVLQGDSDAQFFEPAQARTILGQVDVNHGLLHALLGAEADIVTHAFDAGVRIASVPGSQPSAAIKALAVFGARLTEAFNSDVTALLGRGIQSIGTQVFLDASRAIDRLDADEIGPANAMLSVEFLKPEVKFDRDALVKAGRIPIEQLAFADRVVELQL
jgi:hypothetical protein